MKKKILGGILVLIFLIGNGIGTITAAQFQKNIVTSQMIFESEVYHTSPDWISDDPDYSTGAALADLNHDGWLDLIVADGNDMSLGHLNIYYNNGYGGFSTSASWQSNDVRYNGHIDVADVNGDGWLDVAVAHLGEFNTFGPIARVYLNNNGVLSSLPDWSSNIDGNAFGVAFGDVNNDGRPDLAVATGWSYSPQHFYNNYVYLNVNGVLESTPSWQSSDQNHYMGALWIDADEDGWLDLGFIGSGAQTQIYKNLGGVLETTASWYTQDSQYQDGIMLTGGDVTQDGVRDLFATDNTQLGGSGEFKQYTGLSTGFFETTASWSYYEGYGSAVALADVNGDNLLDLATGAWWDKTRIFLNDGSGLPTNPSWNSAVTSVIEKIVFGDVGPILQEKTYVEQYTPDGITQLFYLPHQQIQKINYVISDSVQLNFDEYMYNREFGWITVYDAPISSLIISYNYSKSLDMVISNWDSYIGNYLYYNQLNLTTPFPDLVCNGELNWIDIAPGEIVNGSFTVENQGDPESELDWEITEWPDWGIWTFTPGSGNDLTPEDGIITVNVQVTAPNEENQEFLGNITIKNLENPNDFGIISVSLATPVSHPRSTDLTSLEMVFTVKSMSFT